MIFCNIWIGDKLPENRQRCMKSFINLMVKNDQYMFISDHLTEYDFMPKNTVYIHSDTVYHEALKKHSDWWRIYSERKVQFKTDFIRLYLACNYPELFYADTDVLLGKQFNMGDIDAGKPILGQWMYISETFLFYVNGSTDYFKFLMKTAEKFPPENVFFPSHLFTLPKTQKGITLFNEETFSHQRLGKY